MNEELQPWHVYVYVQRAATGEVNRMQRRDRMVFVSLATLASLALAAAVAKRKTRKLWLFGLPIVCGTWAIVEAARVLLAIDGWRWVSLGPVLEVPLSAMCVLLEGLPAMPFAFPVLVFLALTAGADASARAISGAARPATR
jgi:hypothetical protein